MSRGWLLNTPRSPPAWLQVHQLAIAASDDPADLGPAQEVKLGGGRKGPTRSDTSRATANNRASPQRLPTSCTPIGRPALDRVNGTTITGFPVTLNGMQCAVAVCHEGYSCPPASLACPPLDRSAHQRRRTTCPVGRSIGLAAPAEQYIGA